MSITSQCDPCIHDSELQLACVSGREIKSDRTNRSSRHEWACLHRALPDRLQNHASLLLPRAERLEQLDDLVPLSLTHVVDANHAHLDVVVEQKVEQTEEPFERVVVLPAWERAVGRDVAPHALDGLCDAEELKPTTDGTLRAYLECAR